GEQIEHQQATFRDVAAAQIKAWRDAADKLQKDAANFGVARRASTPPSSR
ncbi:MAG: hypothetical protein K0Q60_4734, partial [Microvirga sp.]|nr:hypothetical protein [Microvirga sp.]